MAGWRLRCTQNGAKTWRKTVRLLLAQMLIMFAVGVMSLLGMALITLLVIVEKSMPIESKLICKAVGTAFFAWELSCDYLRYKRLLQHEK